VLQSKPASTGPQELTPDEFKSLAGIISPQDGGNNQYHQMMGSPFPRFDVTSASTVNLNGKTALLVKGKYWMGGPSGGLSRESLYIDNPQAKGGTGIEMISLTAPTGQIQQYQQAFSDTANSIRWAQ
jgi:hypothetical protein